MVHSPASPATAARVNRAPTARGVHAGRPARATTSFRAVALLAVGLLAAAHSGPTDAQTPRSAQRVLVVSQTANPGGASLTARIGSLTFGPNGLATDRAAEHLPDASSIAQVAVRDFGDGLTPSQLLSEARVHLANQAPALAATLSAALRSRGLGQATFTFDQQVAVRGSTTARRLVWTLSVDRSGRASFADPRLHDAQPHILHAQYVPLRVAAGLPAGWAYPDAGRLRWQRLNLMMQPIGPMHTLDTGGAFDAPDAVDGLASDPEAGLRCLMDRRTRGDCPQGLTDIVTLIDEQGSASALVDYGLRLAPVYDAVDAGNGRTEHAARISLQVDRRELAYGGCQADLSFRNTGSYGFTLTAANDRYAVAPDGRFARLNRTETTTLSPTITYDVSRQLRPLAVSSLTPLILDPQDPARPMIAAASINNLLYLAPITTSGQSEQTVVSFTSPPLDPTRLQVEIRCSVDGKWTVRSLIAPWAQCLSGSCNSTYRPYEWVFTPGQPALGPAAFTATSYRGVARAMQQAGYDGASTITVWHEDHYCGERIGLRFSLGGQHLGPTHLPRCD